MRKYDYIIVLGITGGVGAGKSTVLRELEKRQGALIIECDRIGKELQSPGGSLYQPMISLFGGEVLKEDGTFDRAMIADKIYENRQLRDALDALVHPAVKAEVLRRLEEEDRRQGEDRRRDALSASVGIRSRAYPRARQGSKSRRLVLVEAALLLEDGYDQICDEIWYIRADMETRRRRLKESRAYSDEKIEAIMRAQKDDAAFAAACQLTIDNSGDIVQNTYKQLSEGLRSRFPDL